MENKCAQHIISFHMHKILSFFKNCTRNTELADILANWELTFSMSISSQQEEKFANFNITLTSPSVLKDKN